MEYLQSSAQSGAGQAGNCAVPLSNPTSTRRTTSGGFVKIKDGRCFNENFKIKDLLEKKKKKKCDITAKVVKYIISSVLGC